MHFLNIVYSFGKGSVRVHKMEVKDKYKEMLNFKYKKKQPPVCAEGCFSQFITLG